MNKLISIIPISLLILSSCSSNGVISQKSLPPKETVMEKSIPVDAMMRKDVTPANAMMQKSPNSGSGIMKQESTKTSQRYQQYSPEILASSLTSKKDVVLFFAASWCPTCRALEQSILGDLSSIPENAVILKVDFDNSAELRQKYGVTVQHTTVVLNPDGSAKSKKLGARNIAEVFAQ